MKTPNLLDVPKDTPSRKERLDAYKAHHGIETHRSDVGHLEHPWLACWMAQARKHRYLVINNTDGIVEACVKGCRILEDAGLLVTGETERKALETLSILCDLPTPP